MFDEAYACALVSLYAYYVAAITDIHMLYRGQTQYNIHCVA